MWSAQSRNASASPRGLSCSTYVREMPSQEPSPRSRRNISWSSGVVMIAISVIPASIRADSG